MLTTSLGADSPRPDLRVSELRDMPAQSVPQLNDSGLCLILDQPMSMEAARINRLYTSYRPAGLRKSLAAVCSRPFLAAAVDGVALVFWIDREQIGDFVVGIDCSLKFPTDREHRSARAAATLRSSVPLEVGTLSFMLFPMRKDLCGRESSLSYGHPSGDVLVAVDAGDQYVGGKAIEILIVPVTPSHQCRFGEASTEVHSARTAGGHDRDSLY